MSVILNEPRVVLWVGHGDGLQLAPSELTGEAVDRVETVETAAEARSSLAASSEIGAVITVPSLPDESGVDLCRSIRDGDDRTPVLLATGREDASTAADALRAGATDCLYFDDTPEEIQRRVGEAVDRHCERQQDQERSRLFATLLDETPVAIYAKDADAKHVTISEMPGELSRSDVIGKTDVEMYQGKPTFAQEALADDLSVIENGEPIEDRLESYGPEGQKNWARTSKFPWYETDGSVGGLIGVTRNVTEYERTERRLEAMEERIDEFTSHLQHDLKTPLQIASGHLEHARESGSADSYDKIDSALDRIEEMVDDIGSMTKLARPEDNIEQTVLLADLIDGVWDVIETDGATLSVELPDDTRIHADANTLRPVFENLFTNAIVHAGPDVIITVGATERGGFYVEDDGPGIPEDEREAVLESGYSTGGDGCGKGLHIVAETVADNDWDLEITDSATGGARFEVNNCLMVESEPTVTDGATLELTEQTVVGQLDAGGEADYHDVADRWIVSADGNGISEETDDFYHVYTTVSGPVSIRGHVTDIQHINDFSTGGLMIRDSLDPDAAYGFVGQTLRFGTEVGWRSTAGSQSLSQNVDEEDLFTWYRLDRVGDQVTCYVSTDGREWVPIDQRRLSLSGEITIGLVGTSSVPGRESRITFESIEVREI